MNGDGAIMKKIINFIAIFLLIIFFILSCKANTGPINSEGTPTGWLKSTSPVLGTAYLWVNITTDGASTSSIAFQFSDNATTPQNQKGEEVKFDGNIDHISPSGTEDVNSYSFQSGTIAGVLEILSETQVNVSFSRNISPYLKINNVVCTTTTP